MNALSMCMCMSKKVLLKLNVMMKLCKKVLICKMILIYMYKCKNKKFVEIVLTLTEMMKLCR